MTADPLQQRDITAVLLAHAGNAQNDNVALRGPWRKLGQTEGGRDEDEFMIASVGGGIARQACRRSKDGWQYNKRLFFLMTIL